MSIDTVRGESILPESWLTLESDRSPRTLPRQTTPARYSLSSSEEDSECQDMSGAVTRVQTRKRSRSYGGQSPRMVGDTTRRRKERHKRLIHINIFMLASAHPHTSGRTSITDLPLDATKLVLIVSGFEWCMRVNKWWREHQLVCI